jgi:hypothetical protein
MVILSLPGFSRGEATNEVKVEIISMLGQVMNAQPVICKGDCDKISLEISERFSPGVYVVKGVADKRQFAHRLIVK